MSIRSPSLDKAIPPPSADSGDAWPIHKPDVPPEKRPSVNKAQDLPNPFDFKYAVGYNISCIPGPPFGPS